MRDPINVSVSVNYIYFYLLQIKLNFIHKHLFTLYNSICKISGNWADTFKGPNFSQ